MHLYVYEGPDYIAHVDMHILIQRLWILIYCCAGPDSHRPSEVSRTSRKDTNEDTEVARYVRTYILHLFNGKCDNTSPSHLSSIAYV